MKTKIFRRKNNNPGTALSLRSSFIGTAYCLLLLCPVVALADDPDLLVCNSKGYILQTKTAAVGATSYKWHEGETLQTGETGESLTVAANKTPGTYSYVRVATNDDCVVSSNTYTVEVMATPDAPTISVTDVCKDAAGNLVFSIAPAANTTYTWTKTAGVDGTPSGDDHSTYTVSSSSTGTTSVKAAASLTYNVGTLSKVCASALTAEKTAKVNPLPTVAQTGDDTFCGSAAITTLTVYAEVNGETSGIDITWYSKNDGTNQVETGTTYTPTLTAGTTGTYYVGATVQVTGCESAGLTTVTGALSLTEGEIDGNEL